MKRFWNYKFTSQAMNLILACVLPICALVLVEYYTHVPSDLTVPIFLVNLCFYYLLYGTLTFLCGKLSTGYFLATLFFMVFGFVNYLVMNFRSTPFVPWDIYSIRTAVSVAGNYKLSPDSHLVASVLGFFCLLLLSSKLSLKKLFIPVRLAGTVIGAVCLFFYTIAIQSEAVIDVVGLDTILFTPKVLYRNNGLATGFLGVLKYLRVEQPSHYSDKAVSEIVSLYETEEISETEELPNIIVIMNEAFSDLSVYGDFETSEDYMPFIHSLEKNTWKGNCYVSVKGGNTANSEYEFLTGNSMVFVPSGSVPYQQYIKSETPSLAGSLAEKGYQTAALHPYNASGWNRNTAYPFLGFQEQYFKTEFPGADTLRGYITDEAAFSRIIDLYENKEAGTPLFAFEVTMQNHGGYSKEYADLTEEIFLSAYPEPNTQIRAAEKYLTLVKKTDEAFEELVSYFEKQDEKTVILMFGDHQPSDYITNVITRLLNLDNTEESTIDLGYIVPYIMWSNYETEEQEIQDISLNYLGTLLMKKAGLPLTGYQQFAEELISTYPVISVSQVRNSAYKLVTPDYENEELLHDYELLNYNLLCDKKHKKWNFFQ